MASKSLTPADLEASRVESEWKARAILREKGEAARWRAAGHAEAKATGEPVEIAQYTDECSDPGKECRLDVITIYAMPDGTLSETREHTEAQQ